MCTPPLTYIVVDAETEITITSDPHPSSSEEEAVRHPSECVQVAGADEMDIDDKHHSSTTLDSAKISDELSTDRADTEIEPSTDAPPEDAPSDSASSKEDDARHPSEYVQVSAAYVMDLEDDSRSSTCAGSHDVDEESTTCTSPTTTAVDEDKSSAEDDKVGHAVKCVRFSDGDYVREFEKDKGCTLIVVVSDDGHVGGEGSDVEDGSEEDASDDEEESRCSTGCWIEPTWEKEYQNREEEKEKLAEEKDKELEDLIRDEVQRDTEAVGDEQGKTVSEEYLKRERATFRAVYHALEVEIGRLTEENESMKEVVEQQERGDQDLKRQYERFWRGVVREVETRLKTMKGGIEDCPLGQRDSSCSKCGHSMEEKEAWKKERLALMLEKETLMEECDELRHEREEAVAKCGSIERRCLGLKKDRDRVKVQMREMIARLEHSEQDAKHHDNGDLKLLAKRARKRGLVEGNPGSERPSKKSKKWDARAVQDLVETLDMLRCDE